jgi:hypothetical protein
MVVGPWGTLAIMVDMPPEVVTVQIVPYDSTHVTHGVP